MLGQTLGQLGSELELVDADHSRVMVLSRRILELLELTEVMVFIFLVVLLGLLVLL